MATYLHIQPRHRTSKHLTYIMLDIPLRKLFGDEYAPSPACHVLCSLIQALPLTCSQNVQAPHIFFLKNIFLFSYRKCSLLLKHSKSPSEKVERRRNSPGWQAVEDATEFTIHCLPCLKNGEGPIFRNSDSPLREKYIV